MQVTLQTRPQFFPSASQAANSTRSTMVADSTKACTNCLSAPTQTHSRKQVPAGSLAREVGITSTPHEFSPVGFFLAMLGAN
jgi:hypothetical protein